MSQRKYLSFLCPSGKPSFILFPASDCHAEILQQIEDELEQPVQLIGAGFYDLVIEQGLPCFQVNGNSHSLRHRENATATQESADYLNSLIGHLAYLIKETHFDDLPYCCPVNFIEALDRALSGKTVAHGTVQIATNQESTEIRLMQVRGAYNTNSRPIFERLVARHLGGTLAQYAAASLA